MSHSGLLSSASSLTNLSSEPDFSLQRCRSASEIFEPNSGSVSRRLKTKQRAKDLRHSIADSRSDYYNNRRPQSISLSSQIPALSNLRSASSISALGTISENEALHGSSYTPFNSVRDSIYVEQPETPIFNYTTLLAESGTPLRRSSFRQQHTRPLSGEINPGPQIVGSGSHQLNGASPNAYANNSPATAPIHVSEPITQDFVPIYLNPLTGQMYSHNHDYFRPIFNPNELIARPPKPVCIDIASCMAEGYSAAVYLCNREYCLYVFHRTGGWRRAELRSLHISSSLSFWQSCSLCVEMSLCWLHALFLHFYVHTRSKNKYIHTRYKHREL